MIEEELKFIDDKLYVYTPLPLSQYSAGLYEVQLVMTKEIFQECYKKWVELGDIEDMPSVKPQKSNWIPVSELPKDKMTCLVYGKMHFTPDHVDEKDWYYDYSIGYYKPKYGWSIRGNMIDSDVMAYMPLPEPYKAERS